MGLNLRLVLVPMIPVVLVGYVRSRLEQAQLPEDQQQDMARTAKAVRIAVEKKCP